MPTFTALFFILFFSPFSAFFDFKAAHRAHAHAAATPATRYARRTTAAALPRAAPLPRRCRCALPRCAGRLLRAARGFPAGRFLAAAEAGETHFPFCPHGCTCLHTPTKRVLYAWKVYSFAFCLPVCCTFCMPALPLHLPLPSFCAAPTTCDLSLPHCLPYTVCLPYLPEACLPACWASACLLLSPLQLWNLEGHCLPSASLPTCCLSYLSPCLLLFPSFPSLLSLHACLPAHASPFLLSPGCLLAAHACLCTCCAFYAYLACLPLLPAPFSSLLEKEENLLPGFFLLPTCTPLCCLPAGGCTLLPLQDCLLLRLHFFSMPAAPLLYTGLPSIAAFPCRTCCFFLWVALAHAGKARKLRAASSISIQQALYLRTARSYFLVFSSHSTLLRDSTFLFSSSPRSGRLAPVPSSATSGLSPPRSLVPPAGQRTLSPLPSWHFYFFPGAGVLCCCAACSFALALRLAFHDVLPCWHLRGISATPSLPYSLLAANMLPVITYWLHFHSIIKSILVCCLLGLYAASSHLAAAVTAAAGGGQRCPFVICSTGYMPLRASFIRLLRGAYRGAVPAACRACN